MGQFNLDNIRYPHDRAQFKVERLGSLDEITSLSAMRSLCDDNRFTVSDEDLKKENGYQQMSERAYHKWLLQRRGK